MNFNILTPSCGSVAHFCETCGSQDAPRLGLRNSPHGPLCVVECAACRRRPGDYLGPRPATYAADHRAHVARIHKQARS